MRKWIVAVFLGDSLTTGFQQGPGYMPIRYYPFTNILESNIRIKLREINIDKDFVIVNQGLDGDSTQGMINRFKENVELENPEIVLIWGGINDIYMGIMPKDLFNNIVKLVSEVKKIDAIPIVLNIAPVSDLRFNETITNLNNLIGMYCKENKVFYVNVYSLLADSEGKLAVNYSNDGVHLSDQAYNKIMTTLFQILLNIINKLI